MGRRDKGRTAPWCAALVLGVAACASGDPPRPAANVPSPSERSGTAADAPRTGDSASRASPSAAPLVGGCGPAPAGLEAKYILPYPVGDRFTLTQGNCGAESHGGRFSYAFDFEMPIGTPVIAARDGVVYAVRQDRPDGSGRVGDENFVFVDHGDGEFSRYIHITKGGARVRRGDRVSRGDTIALSGHSGQSAFPHLHFDVSEGCRDGTCRTVPVAFLNAEPPIPAARQAYDAGSIAALAGGGR